MEPVTPWSADLTLDEVLEHLRGSASVQAVAFLGSTGTDRHRPASDVDLLLVVDRLPARHCVETTLVDGRIADVVFVDAGVAASLGDSERPTDRDWAFVAWLAEARPAHDPAGLLQSARQRARALLATRRVGVHDDLEVTRAFLTHDLRVNAALLQRIDEPVMAVALGMRQLHTFVAAVQAWSSVRGLPSKGWKADIARMCKDDPDTFALVREWLDASDVVARHRLFAATLKRALAPVGGLLPEGTVGGQASRTWSALAAGYGSSPSM